jgi:solute carrier family 25 aspartate/glutamate transporter 12/13
MDLLKGNIAGYIGAISVYPIDVVKSQMQLQANAPNQRKVYKNGLDCFRQIIVQRGVRKLYAGSLIQIIGVGPEKAIKLFVNQQMLVNDFHPVLAGAAAGLCQVLATNPIEILKLQYQAHLEQNITFAKSLRMIGGVKNVYKGVTICAMRDVPFCAVYFPAYDCLKIKLAQWKFNHHQAYLFAGLFAAMPVSFLCTPIDVVKTRIQAKPEIYQKFLQSGKKIFVEEGMSAFFKGATWRIARISPQFAITLYFFEVFTQLGKNYRQSL